MTKVESTITIEIDLEISGSVARYQAATLEEPGNEPYVEESFIDSALVLRRAGNKVFTLTFAQQTELLDLFQDDINESLMWDYNNAD